MLLSISVSGIDMSIVNEFAALNCKMNFRSVSVSFLFYPITFLQIMKMNLIQNSYVKLFEVKDGNPFLMKVMDSPY